MTRLLYVSFSLEYFASVSWLSDYDPVLVISYQLRALTQNIV